MISAKEPAIRAAGTPAPTLTAPPVLTAEGAAWDGVRVGIEVEETRGVEVALALALALALGLTETVIMLEQGVDVAVNEFTLTRVLVMVVVDTEVVSSAATNWAAARQRKEVTRAPNCIFVEKRRIRRKKDVFVLVSNEVIRKRKSRGIEGWTVHRSPAMNRVESLRVAEEDAIRSRV